MKKLFLAASAAALFSTTPAFAQDYDADQDNQELEAPDGSKAFGFEPYVAVTAGRHEFDSEVNEAGIPPVGYDGTIIEGLVGVNVPLGAVFVGAEGSVAKGIDGDIDWEYGVSGRAGARIGESGLVYGKVGYQWVNFDALGKNSPDYDGMLYGVGLEVGPQDIGLGGVTGESGIRLRFEVQTHGDFNSLRPTAGVVAHF